MNDAFFEKVDVFLPGQGDKLTQTPPYHWKRAEHAVGHLYYSVGEPKSAMVHLKGLKTWERKALRKMEVTVDQTGLSYHDFDGYGVHLPGLIVTKQGTVIAVCQRRHDSMADGGHAIDLLMSRSEDDGKSWQQQQVIFEENNTYTYLGPIFEDRTSGAVYVSFWKMPAKVMDDLGFFSEYARQGGGFWLLKSTDEGQTWSAPIYVQPEPNPDGWVGWSNNNVHGIQLVFGSHKGRLVIPAFLYKEGERGEVPGVRSGLLYSDDHAQSWKAGGVLPEGSDEVSVVETVDGGLYVRFRKNTLPTGKCNYALSTDGGESFHEIGKHEELSERGLHAGLARYSSDRDGKQNVLLYSNPLSTNHMMVCMSRDEGRTWPISRQIEPDQARYSDLAVTRDGTILCLYTQGKVRDSEKIVVARFNLEWLRGADN